MDVLDASSPWFWLGLALVIAILEVVTGTFLLLALAAAVASVAVLAVIAPDLASDWRVASPLVAVVWLVCAVIFKRFLGARRHGAAAEKDVNDV
jgi:membrane protein implicated in regulation of membrane protease activity